MPPGGAPFTADTVLTAVDGRATLGWFADAKGAAFLFLANADSLSPRTVTLTLTDGRPPSRLRDDGSRWDRLAVDTDGRVALGLDAGDFVRPPSPPRTIQASVGPQPGQRRVEPADHAQSGARPRPLRAGRRGRRCVARGD